MTRGRRTGNPGAVFEVLGVAEDEETAYRALLAATGPVTEAALARTLDRPRADVHRSVTTLVDRGLAQRVAGARGALVAVPPAVALDGLLLERERALEREAAELTRARAAAAGLQEELRRTRTPDPLDVIEIVVGREATSRRATALLRATRDEVLVMDTAPYEDPLDQPNEDELELLGRGVSCRALYDAVACEQPGMLTHILAMARAGERARVVRTLPLKAMIIDRRIAVLPVSRGSFLAAGDGALVVHPSSVLDALLALYESLWESGAEVAPGAAPGEREYDTVLLGLLAGGLKDEAIARQLGVSVRTLGRRMNDLMASLGASTRFQAGLQARGRGLI